MIKGERFEIDLDSSDEEEEVRKPLPSSIPFIKDILEQENETIAPPALPKFKSTENGFPQPKVRKGPSRFRQESKVKRNVDTGGASSRKNVSFEESEMRRIDQENQQRIQDMSPEEIDKERKELFAGLSESLIERLLKRSTIEEPQEDFDKPLKESKQTHSSDGIPQQEKKKSVTFATVEPDREKGSETSIDASSAIITNPDVSTEAANFRSIHFPTAPAPSLDPSSDTFLQDLHKKYFPTLSYDPQSLAWMTPVSQQGNELSSGPLSYSPSANSFSPAELRFDFSGNLLPPNLAHQIPTTKGLHHHGLAPEAAGYTLNELSIYARSTVQAQRCMAFQTLGRFLFKLGTGVFGDDGGAQGDIIDEDDEGAVLCRGLWDEVLKERILDTLVEEASKDASMTRHMSAHAMAVEAVWLWRRGGGRWPGKARDEADTNQSNGSNTAAAG